MSVQNAKDVKIYPCEPGRIRKRWYKVFPYEAVAEELRKGREVLVEGISRQLAHYASEKLSKMLKTKVCYGRGELSSSSFYVSGYAFFIPDGVSSSRKRKVQEV